MLKISYGRLYNFYAVSGSTFAPTDWKVPLYSDFATLITAIGGITGGGTKLKNNYILSNPIGTTAWAQSAGVSNSNSTNFTALPSGYRDPNNGSFSLINDFTFFYVTDTDVEGSLGLSRYSNDISKNYNIGGSPVRLVYDGVGTPPSTIQDYDGNVYDVVQIGTQYWTVQNWASTHYNNGDEIPNVTGNTEWTTLTTGAWSAYNNDLSYVGDVIPSNDLIIRGSLNINNTTIISGITNDYLSIDDNMLFTSNATQNYTIYKKYKGIDKQILINSGGTISGTTDLIFDGIDLHVTGNTMTSNCLISDYGAMCIKMINKTGGLTEKGKLVTYNSDYNNSFKYYPSGNTTIDPYIGVTLEDNISDGDYTYIVIYGICDVKLSSTSRKVFENTLLSSWDSINDGDILNSKTSGWSIGHSLEESEPGNIIKCLLYYNDLQFQSGGY